MFIDNTRLYILRTRTNSLISDACGRVARICKGVQFRGETGARAGGGAAEGQGQRSRTRGGHQQVSNPYIVNNIQTQRTHTCIHYSVKH